MPQGSAVAVPIHAAVRTKQSDINLLTRMIELLQRDPKLQAGLLVPLAIAEP
jgi:hypothetical protein